MKRKTLLLVALFALVSFFGAAGLSAQTWVSQQQALVLIQGTISSTVSPNKTGLPAGSITSPAVVKVTPATGASNRLKVMKVDFLKAVAEQIKLGATTGDAVNTVYANFQQLSGFDVPARQNALQQVYFEVVDLLS
ncbi:MAG: hypothetical protein IT269_04995 [Saprospiraceae bacterium]|nr:hypothetical protein [Saprospiraceae bacterium]